MPSVCVFAGSSPGNSPVYLEAARKLGASLARLGIRAVYGGASIGLMGAMADAALAAEGQVIGVIPHAIADRELAHSNLTELHLVGSMHERKAMMADLADAFIALPGGIGTLEETFEVWTWRQLAIHHKPIGLLNTAGFYDALIGFLKQQAAAGFVRTRHLEALLVEGSPESLLERMAPMIRSGPQGSSANHKRNFSAKKA